MLFILFLVLLEPVDQMREKTLLFSSFSTIIKTEMVTASVMFPYTAHECVDGTSVLLIKRNWYLLLGVGISRLTCF